MDSWSDKPVGLLGEKTIDCNGSRLGSNWCSRLLQTLNLGFKIRCIAWWKPIAWTRFLNTLQIQNLHKDAVKSHLCWRMYENAAHKWWYLRLQYPIHISEKQTVQLGGGLKVFNYLSAFPLIFFFYQMATEAFIYVKSAGLKVLQSKLKNLQLYPMKLTILYELLASQSFNELNYSVMSTFYNIN